MEPVKTGEHVPFLAKVVDDHDAGHVVLEIIPGAVYVSISQADVAAHRADRPAQS